MHTLLLIFTLCSAPHYVEVVNFETHEFVRFYWTERMMLDDAAQAFVLDAMQSADKYTVPIGGTCA